MPETPGGALPKWQQFEVRVDQESGKTKGFKDPEGKYYTLEEDEEFIQEKMGTERRAFIRKNGENIPFETWKQGK